MNKYLFLMCLISVNVQASYFLSNCQKFSTLLQKLKGKVMNKELLDVLNEDGSFTGLSKDRAMVHQHGLWHRAIHCYVFNSQQHILMQKRSSQVDHAKDLWSIAVVGHVKAGESSFDACEREISEEMGISPNVLKPEFLFSYRRQAILNPCYIDRQFNDIYVSFSEISTDQCSLKDPSVAEWKWIPIKEFQGFLSDPKYLLAGVYKQAFDTVVYLKPHYFQEIEC
ncbi:MAG: hypothetical protein BGO07_03745 [Alphaproteobacteria bacterium 40-19]|nr:MAG: hypothetical protein BGO07_03745 [Alphaproteobacteria bacterium 40-19]